MSDFLRACWSDLGIAEARILERGLPVFSEAARLVVAETDAHGREHRLTPEAARAWSAMKAAAYTERVSLHIVSAHRSIDRQVQIIRRKLTAGQSIEQILAVSAPPGCSEHHTGRAVDIGTSSSVPLQAEFEDTSAFRWLRANAKQFEFTLSYPKDNPFGFTYEPWHWCYRAAPANGV